MPKLIGQSEKTLFGLQVEKENREVFFNDEYHEYRDKIDGSKYISVTQIVGKYKTPFNADFWSSYKACEALLDPSVFSVLKPILLQSKV